MKVCGFIINLMYFKNKTSKTTLVVFLENSPRFQKSPIKNLNYSRARAKQHKTKGFFNKTTNTKLECDPIIATTRIKFNDQRYHNSADAI
jgi:hypothetical protein